MEFVGKPRPSGACNFLGVPGLSSLDVDDDDGEVVIGIRPKSSPLPRRKSSVSDEDSEPEPPLCGSRKVSFADAKGLSLVQVKEFDTWNVPKLPGYDSSDGEGKDAEEYLLSPVTFSLPLSTEELFLKVREQKVELETIELIPGTTILKGVIRVLNISFNKAVYVRTTLDTWSSHFDLLAEYIPSTSDSLMDCFSFKLTLVPPFGEQGARVDFCLRYETSVGTFWANNNDRNYVLFCHQRVNECKGKQQKKNVNKKSCLKMVGQNFATVENISAMEASSQETISTDVSKHGGEVDTMKPKQMPDGQSGTSEEDGQKLLTESRQNCSRRSRRKAARMARVKDYFAQRGGGANGSERDESPPGAKQAAQEETPEEKHSDVQSFSEGSSKSEGAQFVSESLETCSKQLLDVLSDISPAHDCTCCREPEKSESINLADSLTRGASSTDIPDNPLHSNDEPAPADSQNINESVSKAEERSQKQDMNYECISNIAAEPADSVISAVSSRSLVRQTNSFTFGTVVAPLYHQVFGRVGSESQSSGDWGNPVRATLNVGDLTQSYSHTERRESSCTVPTDGGGNNDNVQGNVIKAQESNQESLDVTPNSPPTEEGDTCLSVQDPVEIIHSDTICPKTSEGPNTISGDTVVHPHTVTISNPDLLNPQIPSESLHLQGEAQEDNLTHDPQSQTTAGTAQAPLPEHTQTQIKANLDETLAQLQTQKVMTSLETSIMSLQPSQSVSERISDETDQQTSDSGDNDCKRVDESNKDEEVGKTVTTSPTTVITEEDILLEALHTTPPTPLETQVDTNNVEEGNNEENKSHKDEKIHSAEIKVIDEVAGSVTGTIMSHNHIHVVGLKDEAIIVSEKIEHREMEAAVIKQEDICLADTTDVKNWEMMVEEEEKNILTGEDEREVIRLKAEDIEAVVDGQGEQLEDAEIETASENTDTTEKEKEKTEDKMVGEITAAREKESTAEDADVLEDKQRIGEGGIEVIVARKDREEIEKELQFNPATKTEKTAGEEELTEETELGKREGQQETELEKEKHFAEIHKVNIKKINVREEEQIEGEEEMEIDLNSDDEAGVEWDNQIQNVEEENPDYKEDILVDETGESEMVDQSESMSIEDRGDEVERFEERLDITPNKAEDSYCALVNNVQDKRVIDKENTGEGQNAHIATEMHLYQEEHFQSKDNVTHDLSEDARDEKESAAAEGGSCVFADEPERDQMSHDSAESDSDDEVELYMHCLRAVHSGAQAHKDRSKSTAFNAGKRPSVSRSKLLSTPMPSISESLDEEQPLSHLQDNHEDTETADIPPTAAALPASSGQESINRNVSWWIETFSCNNISKTLLYAALLVVFVVLAYHYDFLACFGLYLISVVWLCCQGERQPVKNNNRIG